MDSNSYRRQLNVQGALQKPKGTTEDSDSLLKVLGALQSPNGITENSCSCIRQMKGIRGITATKWDHSELKVDSCTRWLECTRSNTETKEKPLHSNTLLKSRKGTVKAYWHNKEHKNAWKPIEDIRVIIETK